MINQPNKSIGKSVNSIVSIIMYIFYDGYKARNRKSPNGA